VVRKLIAGIGVVLGLAVLSLAIWIGPVVWDFWRGGFLKGQDRSTYEGGRRENLIALHRAVLLYAQSEGALPEASGWMDAAMTRAETADLGREEALKKFVRPGVEGPDNFGYGMNSTLSRVYPGDVSKPAETILLFESHGQSWNLSGDPTADGAKYGTIEGAIGIAVDGSIQPIDPSPGQKSSRKD
jgi:hypothetical protein